MDHRRIATCALTIGLVGAGAASARAERISPPMTFTGNVEADFPTTPGGPVTVIPGNGLGSVAQADWITKQGWINGWNMKDLRFAYDRANDTLNVGINFYGIAGDADGNGDPGGADPRTVASGGVDTAHLGGRKSISVAFAGDAPNTHALGSPVIIAGVPANKDQAGPGIDGFTVANYKATNQGIEYNYGPARPENLGALAFDPSKAHPGFEFTVKDFSKIPGLDPKTGFWVQAFAGSPDDIVAGEDSIGWVRLPKFAEQTVPEPTTLVAWSLLAGGAAWGIRRSRRRDAQV